MLQNDISKAYRTALNLERTVIEDAEKTAKQIVREAKLAEKAALDAAASSAAAEAEQYERTRRSEITARYSNLLTEHTELCRNLLIKKRNDIQSDVFSRLRDRLGELTSSEAYADISERLLLKPQSSGIKLSDNTEIAVSAIPTDRQVAEKHFPNSRIYVSENIKLGGFILRDNDSGIVYDLTLDSDYEALKSDFPAVIGLKISD